MVKKRMPNSNEEAATKLKQLLNSRALNGYWLQWGIVDITWNRGRGSISFIDVDATEKLIVVNKAFLKSKMKAKLELVLKEHFSEFKVGYVGYYPYDQRGLKGAYKDSVKS